MQIKMFEGVKRNCISETSPYFQRSWAQRTQQAVVETSNGAHRVFPYAIIFYYRTHSPSFYCWHLFHASTHTFTFYCVSSLTATSNRHTPNELTTHFAHSSPTQSPPWPTTYQCTWTPPPTRRTTAATSSTRTTANLRPRPRPPSSTSKIALRASSTGISDTRRGTLSQSSLSSSSSFSSPSPISTVSSQALPSNSIPSPIE